MILKYFSKRKIYQQNKSRYWEFQKIDNQFFLTLVFILKVANY